MSVDMERNLKWLKLDILDSSEEDDKAIVEFEARLFDGGGVNALHEKSHFVRLQGRWFYTNGEMLQPTFKPWKPARKEPCPCNSGKKFKNCCEALAV